MFETVHTKKKKKGMNFMGRTCFIWGKVETYTKHDFLKNVTILVQNYK